MNHNEQAIRLQNSLRAMLNWFLREDTVMKDHQAEMVAENIAVAYDNFSFLSRDETTTNLSIKPYVPEDHQTGPLTVVNFMYESMKQFRVDELVSHFILHGSLATGDYVEGWSDVDTLVVVKKETINNSELLCRLRHQSFMEAWLKMVDPLCHHGLIFVSEYDLQSYPSYYMPIPAIENGMALIGGDLYIRERECKEEIRQGLLSRIALIRNAHQERLLKHHDYYGEYLEENYANYENGMYQMKYYLGLISLLPAQLLGLQGRPCYKGGSFDLARPLFSDEAWKIVDKITQIRLKWGQEEKPRKEYERDINQIPKWLQEDLGPDYFAQALPFLEELEKHVSEV